MATEYCTCKESGIDYKGYCRKCGKKIKIIYGMDYYLGADPRKHKDFKWLLKH